jgi:predicted PurR-regulated permease PerM
MTSDAEAPEPFATAAPPDTAGAGLVPGWLLRLAAIGWRVLVTVALIAVVGYIAFEPLSIVTGAILVALIVTATVYPLVQRLRVERNWSRGRAAAAISVLALLVVVVTIILIALAFIPYIADVLRLAQSGVTDLTERLTALGVPQAVLDIVDLAVDDLEAWALSAISDLVDPIATFVTILILGGFLTFYLLEDGDRAWAAATKELDDWRATQLTGRGMVALEQVGGYLRGTAVMATMDAFTDWLYLSLLGVAFAGPLAVLIFIGGFIPYLGGIVMVSVAALVALASQGPLQAVVFVVLVGLTNVVQSRFLAPRVYGPNARISPAVAVIALPAGAALFGVLGLFATVPVVAMVAAFAPAIVASLGRQSERPSSNPLVPVWLDRLGQWSWRVLVVLGLAWLIVQLAVAPFFSAPVVIALLLSAVLFPISTELRRRGMSGTYAAIGVTAGTIAIVVIVFGLTVVTLAQSLPEVIDTSATGATKIGLGNVPGDIVHTVGDGLAGAVTAVVRNAAGAALAVALAILLTFFFLRDGATWWQRIVARVDPVRRDRVNAVGITAGQILQGTTIGTTIASFAGAVLQWFTMAILGLPLAFPIGVLTFFGGFIPYIGSFITTALGFLVALAVGSPLDILLMLIFTLVFNIVQGNVVAPLVYGKTVSIHPAIVLLAAPAGAAIGGILGMVMIVPIIAIITRTWRIVIHLFDPEDAQPTVASAPSPNVRTRPAPAPRSTTAAEPAEP